VAPEAQGSPCFVRTIELGFNKDYVQENKTGEVLSKLMF
jgi:hypothetical protein